MALTNTVTGTYTLDETNGIENGADGTPTPGARDDSDMPLDPTAGFAHDLKTDALTFYNYLFTTLGLPKTFPTNVDVAESSPSIINVQDSSGGTISSIGLTNSTGGSFTGNTLTDYSGVDTTSGHKIYLVSALDNQIVLGMYDSDNDASHTLDSVAFAVYMKPDGALDSNVNVQLFSVTFTALKNPVAGSDTQAYDDAVDLLQNVFVHSTGELHINFDNMPSGANLFNDAAESASGGGIIVFGETPITDSSGKYTNASDYISTSQGGTGATIGVDSQMFNPDEGAYFTYVNDIDDRYLSGLKKGLSATEADYAQNMQYASLIEAHTASVHISQIQNANNPAGVTITAFELDSAYKGQALLDNRGDPGDAPVPIDRVIIYAADGVTVLADSNIAGPQNGITISISAGGIADVQGLSVSNIIQWHTTSEHNQVLIHNSSPAGKFDIGGFDIKEGSSDTDSLAGHSYVEDSGPAIGPISDGGGDGATGNPAPLDYAANATVTHSLNGDIGTDTPGSYAITSFATSITLTGVTLTGADQDGTGQTIQYFQDVNHDGDYDSAGATPDVLYYTMSLTPAGSYTFTVNNAPAAPDLVFHFDNLPSGDNLFGTVAENSTSPGMIVFGEAPHLKAGKMDNTSDTVATSQGGTGATIGIDNQMFDPGDGAYFTVVKNIVADFLSGAPGGLSSTEADYAKNIQYTGGLYGVQGATLGVSQVQGNVPIDAKFTCYDLSGAPQGSDLLFADHAGKQVDIASVLVTHADGSVDNNVTITINPDGTAEVDNLSSGDLIKVMSAGSSDLFNQVLVEDLSGKFDVGSFGISQAQTIPDQVLPFKVTATDGDSDTAVSNEFHVYIDGNHDGLIT